MWLIPANGTEHRLEAIRPAQERARKKAQKLVLYIPYVDFPFFGVNVHRQFLDLIVLFTRFLFALLQKVLVESEFTNTVFLTEFIRSSAQASRSLCRSLARQPTSTSSFSLCTSLIRLFTGVVCVRRALVVCQLREVVAGRSRSQDNPATNHRQDRNKNYRSEYKTYTSAGNRQSRT